MAKPMAADLEIRIGHQLLGALLVGLHPFAAGEERGLDPLRAQKIDDAPVIAGDIAVRLAEIESERDELLAGGKRDPSDRPTELRRHGRGQWQGLLPQGGEVEVMTASRQTLAIRAGKSFRRPATIEQALIRCRGRQRPARGT